MPPAIAALLGVFVMAVWQSGDWRIAAFGSDKVPMAPITAALFVVLGVALVASRILSGSGAARRLEIGGAVVALAVVALEGARAFAPMPLPWDTWFEATEFHLGAVPLGRMANLTAVTFLLAAVAMLTKGLRHSIAAWVSTLASAGCLSIGGVVLAGYATGVPHSYGSASVPMALLTALAFALLGTGLLLNGPAVELGQRWLARNVTTMPEEADRAFSRRLLVVSAIVAVLLAAAGVVFIRSEQAAARQSVWRELDSVVSLKADQLAAWREERMAEGHFLRSTPAVAADLTAFLARPDDPGALARVRGWLEPIKGGDRYEAIAVLDARLDVKLSVPDRPKELTSTQRGLVLAAMQGGVVTLTELHRDTDTGEMHLSVIVPVFSGWKGGVAPPPEAEPLGAVLLMLDAGRNIFPGIREWPVASATAEILLVQRDGDDVVFLSNPRHGSARSALMRRSMHEPLLPSAMVVRGETGVREGRDYRDMPVVFTSRAVRGSAWLLVAKVDLEEVYAPLRRMAARSALLITLVLVALSLGAAAIWRQRQAAFLKRSLAAEKERSAIAERLSLVMQHANDIIFLLDESGRIVEANDRAVAVYGYTLEELRALPPGGLRPAGASENLDTHLGTLLSTARGRFETIHRRKDGTEFPVEASGRFVEAEGRRLALGIYRDISERKAHEQQLGRLNRLYAALSQMNQAIVFATERDALLAKICSVLVEAGGFQMATGLNTETEAITGIVRTGRGRRPGRRWQQPRTQLWIVGKSTRRQDDGAPRMQRLTVQHHATHGPVVVH